MITMRLVSSTRSAAMSAFFDRRKVLRELERPMVKVLSKIGAHVRRTARSSIRKPRRMQLSELSPEQRENRRRLQRRIARGRFTGPDGRRAELKPLPFASSKPGEPPRSQTGRLKDNIFFRYDQVTKSVVIGPVLLSRRTGAPEVLEYGGQTVVQSRHRRRVVRIEPRPFMAPALVKNLGVIPSEFRDILGRR